MTILIVEDDKGLGDLLKEVLEDNGYRTIITSSGEEALGAIDAFQVDLILLDIILPGIDGYEVCRQVKARKGLTYLPIIMITGKRTLPDKLVGLETGADDYLTKPFSIDELLARIKSRLRTREMSQKSHRLYQQKEEELTALGYITTVISEARNLKDFLNQCLNRINAVMDLQGSGIYMLDQKGEPHLQAYRGILPETREEMSSPSNSELNIPILYQDNLLGSIYLWRSRDKEFTQDETKFFNIMSYQIGWAIENALLLQRLTQEKERMEELNEELARLGKFREDLLLVVSHELGTPICNLRAYVETLAREPGIDTATKEDFLMTMKREMERLSRLLTLILDASYIQSGRLTLNYQPINLEVLAGEVSRTITNSKCPIVVNAISPLHVVLADRDRIYQVMINLLDNALKWSPEGSPIFIEIKVESLHPLPLADEVQASKETSWVVTRVRDQGPGIAQEKQSSIFQRFGHMDQEAGRGKGGMGLGLYISKIIVESHGGRIWVESGLGIGSTFAFALPIPNTEVRSQN